MSDDFDIYILTNGQIAKEIGGKLKSLRISKKITQQELANNTGLAAKTIIALEAGKNVSFDTFISVLRSLDKLCVLEAFMQPEPLRPSIIFKQEKSYAQTQKKRVRKSKNKNDE